MPITIVQRPAHASNFRAGRGLGAPRLIVIHTMQGSARGTAAWFACEHGRPPPGWKSPDGKPYVVQAPSSAHYGISAAGDVDQYVSEDDTALHAGNFKFNEMSIGIELEGDCDKGPGIFTAPMLSALVDLCHGICDRYGIPASRVTIIGHAVVPNPLPGHVGETGGAGRHHDPGPDFPWRPFLLALSGAQTLPTT